MFYFKKYFIELDRQLQCKFVSEKTRNANESTSNEYGIATLDTKGAQS